MTTTTTTTFIHLLVLLIFQSVIAQKVEREPAYYNWFDSEVNRFNTGLFNGIEYIEQFRTINEKHKFFKSNEFQMSSIEYDGQFYDKVPLKYDLNTDQLLYNVGYNYPYPILILFTSKVKKFSINGSDFVTVTQNEGDLPMSGFYELLTVNEDITLLKKNKKKRYKRIRGTTLYFEFIEQNSYIVKHKEEYHKIHSKKDIIRIWPNKKVFINKYFNIKAQKTNEDKFWIVFFNKLADTYK